MVQTNNVTLRFGTKALFEDVNIKFTEGNCYGLIGANGSGKSTFLKLLSGELDTTSGEIMIPKDKRVAVLKQNHYEYDEKKVIDTVIMGNDRLFEIMNEREQLYVKEDFNEKDGLKLGDLEAEFADLNGWMAESEAATLLSNLGIDIKLHEKLVKDLNDRDKVKVLLAQALFGNPDILLLDEPTNHLDIDAIKWLEEFLIEFSNIVIVVSHDRHFLNKVCTHIADIDYGKIKLYVGNYDFWYESSQLMLQQMKDSNRKKEEKIKELQDFIARFSANASKSKQATSRKKSLEKIELDEIRPSTRKYPYIDFKPNKLSGKEILTVKDLSYKIDDKVIFEKVSFTVFKNDKIAFVGPDDIAKTILFKILVGELEPASGEITWGKTIEKAYYPKDNTEYFKGDLKILEWIQQYYGLTDEQIMRGFLGRMLFSNDDVFKKVSVLSGGEKVRCMLSKCMLEAPNLLIMDEPTNHLDLESITSLNKGLEKFQGEILFSSFDHQFIQTVATRIIEIGPNGMIDKSLTYDEYLENENLQNKAKTLY